MLALVVWGEGKKAAGAHRLWQAAANAAQAGDPEGLEQALVYLEAAVRANPERTEYRMGLANSHVQRYVEKSRRIDSVQELVQVARKPRRLLLGFVPAGGGRRGCPGG